ncbi:MAG: hypothetical protein ACSHW0_17735 [Thalassotalea sp.]
MSFFKKMFGEKEQARQLSSAKDLTTGDIIVLSDSFGLPENLRAQQFQVTAVNSYEYEHKTQTEWTLTGENNIELFLSLEEDDVSYLKFALKIEHHDVESLFDLASFAQIFEQDMQAQLTKLADNAKTQGWSSELYQQHAFAQVGYFHRKDHRTTALSAYEGKEAGEQFELYTLYDQDEDRGIDVEVWSDGDTDVFLTLFRPLTDIVDMYPGS